MTTLIQGDTEYVYLPGHTETLRFTVTDDGFNPDPSWSRTYRTADDGTTTRGGDDADRRHDTVVFPNNNTVLVGVSAPLEMLWQSTTDPNSSVSSVNATSTDVPGGSFAPPPGDPFENSVVVAADAVNGRLAAWRITDDGSLEKMWVTDRYAISVGAAIVADQHRLYTDDRECNADGHRLHALPRRRRPDDRQGDRPHPKSPAPSPASAASSSAPTPSTTSRPRAKAATVTSPR